MEIFVEAIESAPRLILFGAGHVALPTAVAALADALSEMGNIGTAKDLVFTDFSKRADQLLLGEAGGPSPDPDETLTEAEFLISVLKDKGIVDELVVRAIR